MIFKYKAYNTDASLNFDINLEKNKNVYCFIGENAAGKTNPMTAKFSWHKFCFD